MAVATFQGTVEDGQVRLAADVQLPEHATVYVVVPDIEQAANGKKGNLAELVAQMPPEYEVREEGFGEPVPAHSQRADGQRMAAALQRIAALGTFAGIADPVAWQRAERADRELPNRAE